MSHPCPIIHRGQECGVRLPSRLLMCGKHWQQVPQTLKRAVSTGWKGERGEDYWNDRQAALDAVQALYEKEAPADEPYQHAIQFDSATGTITQGHQRAELLGLMMVEDEDDE